MRYIKEFTIPPTGEDIDEARVVAWCVKPGQAFSAGDTLLEIETDKSVIEIPAEEEGIMKAQLVEEGGKFDFASPIAQLEVEGVPAEDSTKKSAAHEASPTQGTVQSAQYDLPSAGAALSGAAPLHAREATKSSLASEPIAATGRLLATPAARTLANEAGIDLAALEGTGPEGRIVKADVAALLNSEGRQAIPPQERPYSRGPEEILARTSQGEVYLKRWDARPVEGPGHSAKPTVVMLHGMFGDIDTWAATVSSINRANVPVVAIDLPCHGNSLSNAHTIDDIADAIVQVLQVHTNGPVSLVGHSFGAAVAARVGSRLGNRLASVVLLAPVGLGTEIGQSFLSGMTNADTDEALARELRKLTDVASSLSGTYLKSLRTRLQDRRRDLAALCASLSRNGVQQVDISGDLAKLTCPAVIIQGRCDGIIPWQHALNAPPRTALHMLPHVGHMPHWESPALVAEIIVKVLES